MPHDDEDYVEEGAGRPPSPARPERGPASVFTLPSTPSTLLARSAVVRGSPYQVSLPADLRSFDMLDPSRRPLPARPATTMTSLSAEAFPSPAEFEGLVQAYLDKLSSKKREKALVSSELYDEAVRYLLSPSDTTIGTAQFRFWVKKTFELGQESDSFVLYHETKPVARKEWLYDILVFSHREAGHGGRDKTGYVSGRYWSWVPKTLVTAFVTACPHCSRRRSSQSGRGSTGLNTPAKGLPVSSPYARTTNLIERRASISRSFGDRRGSVHSISGSPRTPIELPPTGDYFASPSAGGGLAGSPGEASHRSFRHSSHFSLDGSGQDLALLGLPLPSPSLLPPGPPRSPLNPLLPAWREAADDDRRGSIASAASFSTHAPGSPATPFDEQQSITYEGRPPFAFDKPFLSASPSSLAIQYPPPPSDSLVSGGPGAQALGHSEWASLGLSTRSQWQAHCGDAQPFELERSHLALARQGAGPSGVISGGEGREDVYIEDRHDAHALDWEEAHRQPFAIPAGNSLLLEDGDDVEPGAHSFQHVSSGLSISSAIPPEDFGFPPAHLSAPPMPLTFPSTTPTFLHPHFDPQDAQPSSFPISYGPSHHYSSSAPTQSSFLHDHMSSQNEPSCPSQSQSPLYYQDVSSLSWTPQPLEPVHEHHPLGSASSSTLSSTASSRSSSSRGHSHHSSLDFGGPSRRSSLSAINSRAPTLPAHPSVSVSHRSSLSLSSSASVSSFATERVYSTGTEKRSSPSLDDINSDPAQQQRVLAEDHHHQLHQEHHDPHEHDQYPYYAYPQPRWSPYT